MSELVELLKTARTLKSQIEILSRCRLTDEENAIIATVLTELNILTTNYLHERE